MKQKKLSNLVRIGVVAAIYAALTIEVAPLSYGAVQLRLSEILTLLCFYRKEYGFALVLGCAIANLFSPLGMVDLVFGVASTVFAVLFMPRMKKLWAASLFPAISMVFVAWELQMLGSPFWFSLFTCALGELLVVTVMGVPLFSLLEQNRFFRTAILGKDN